MNIRFAFLALMPVLLLASCADDAAPTVEEGEREASGEVLEGSISDEMLPLEQVRSQAPSAAAESEEADADGDPDADADADAETETE